MKITILSDLHREFWKINIPFYDCDAIVFAGDIACPIQESMEFLLDYSKKLKKPVIAVLGNHDFYRSNYEDALDYARKRATESQYLYLLEKDSCVINDIKFIGCTLWSDFSYKTGGNVSIQEDNAYIAQADISDFYEIRFSKENKKFSAMKCISLFQGSVNYLKEELQNTKDNQKVVIVTHFGIDKQCSNKKHFNSNLQPYFISNVHDLLHNYNIDLWIYGHTHCSNTFSIANTRIVGNQVGYPTENKNDVKTNMNLFINI